MTVWTTLTKALKDINDSNYETNNSNHDMEDTIGDSNEMTMKLGPAGEPVYYKWDLGGPWQHFAFDIYCVQTSPCTLY